MARYNFWWSFAILTKKCVRILSLCFYTYMQLKLFIFTF